MFILAYEVDYEGQQVLGVYSTLDAAMVAVQRQGISEHGDFRECLLHDLVIRQVVLDAEPEFDAGTVVWAYPQE
jgi:hypothetical protein